MNGNEAGAAGTGGGSGNQGVQDPAPQNPPITPAPVTSPPAAPAAPSAADLATFRAAIVAANPDAIPELIAGDSFAAIQASVAGAKTAYAGVAERLKAGGAGQPPKVPAGGGETPAPDLSKLSPGQKIAYGLEQRDKRRAAS